jgi:hypothetical protein
LREGGVRERGGEREEDAREYTELEGEEVCVKVRDLEEVEPCGVKGLEKG